MIERIIAAMPTEEDMVLFEAAREFNRGRDLQILSDFYGVSQADIKQMATEINELEEAYRRM